MLSFISFSYELTELFVVPVRLYTTMGGSLCLSLLPSPGKFHLLTAQPAHLLPNPRTKLCNIMLTRYLRII